MATTSAHLYARIYEVLCDGRGVRRTIPEAYRFARRSTSTDDRTRLSTRAKTRPMVDVSIDIAAADFGAADELADEHLYRCTIVVRRYYFLGYESDPAAVESTLVRVFDDYCRTRAALCHPANLVQTEAGNDTGIGGPALVPTGTSETETPEEAGTGRDRLLIATDTYEAAFSYDPDA